MSWQAPADGASPITGYTAVASPGGASCTADAPATSCRITGLKDGSAYTFTVTATNAFGTSPASEPTAPVTLSYPAGGDQGPGKVVFQQVRSSSTGRAALRA